MEIRVGKSSSEITGYFREIEETDRGVMSPLISPMAKSSNFPLLCSCVSSQLARACTHRNVHINAKQYLWSSIIHPTQHWYLFCCCFMHGWALCKFKWSSLKKVCPTFEGRVPCALFGENHERDMNKLDFDLNFFLDNISVKISRWSMKEKLEVLLFKCLLFKH